MFEIFQGVNLLSREGNGQTGHRMLTVVWLILITHLSPPQTSAPFKIEEVMVDLELSLNVLSFKPA